jgi:nucleoside-diphosphate-sugar epimerase
MRPKDGRVVSNFIVQALQKKALSVYGDGSQTRSFCYADDLVRGIVALLLASTDSTENGRTIHYPVNIGNPRELTVLEIAKMVLNQTGSTSPIEHHPLPIDDPKVRRPDIQRAKTLLNWEPQVTLEEGLSKTITYFESIL